MRRTWLDAANVRPIWAVEELDDHQARRYEGGESGRE
jgi:hypothetical protein